MAQDEKMLEELYELLTLYFEFSLPSGLVKMSETHNLVEPALDRVILREAIFARITAIIVGGDGHENR